MGAFLLPAVGAGAGAGEEGSGLPDIDGKVFDTSFSLDPEGKPGNSTVSLFGEEVFVLLPCIINLSEF